MKRFLALLLALTFSLFCFAGCSKIGSDGNGAEIDIYLGTKPLNLDPAIAYTDENTVQILNLIFEGLFKLDSNGKLQKALCKKNEVYETARTSITEMKITINSTHWSDGSEVQANDIVYAWRRILDPEFSSPAASMLYAIRGAKAAKLGEISIYDIGVYPSSKNTIVVEFEDGADIDEFLYNLASPALVPLRENKISTYTDTWSRSSTDLSSNGPFRVRKFSSNPTEILVLQRSKYYNLNIVTKTEGADKFVTPYRINIHFDQPVDLSVVYLKDAQESVMSQYAAKELFYLSSITKSVMEANSLKLKYIDASSTFSYIFNCNKSYFADPKVRYALSIALDREYMAELVGMGTEAATSLLPSMVFNTKKGTSFQQKSGDVLPATAQLDEAKRLISKSGINPKSIGQIEVYYRLDPVNDSAGSDRLGYQSKERAIAQYTKTAWEELGFSVVVRGVGDAEMETRYNNGSYDVMAIDFSVVSPYAFYNLAQFAREYSGSSKLVMEGDANFDESVGQVRYYISLPHICGYVSEAFEALIDSAYSEQDEKAKAQILHDAEKTLLEEGGICPLVFNKTNYTSQEISGLKTTYWGTVDIKKANLKNYEKYNFAETTDEETEETEETN